MTSNPINLLTTRQNQILALLAVGKSNKEIAQELGIKKRTVEHHITQILQKLELNNRTEAALWFQGKNQGNIEEPI